MNQTEPMKAYAKIFGKASNIASVMRSLLRPVIPNPKDGEMQRQFQNCLQHWLLISPLSDPSPQNDIPFVTGFQFNNESDLRGRCKIDLQVNRTSMKTISLFIPSFVPVDNIVAPAYTTSLHLKIAAAGYNFQTKIITGSYSFVLNIDYNNNPFVPAELEIPLLTATGNLIIAAAAITYNAMRKGSLVASN